MTCCRFCGTELKDTFVDLGMSPLSNAFLKEDDLGEAETFYPLHVEVCHQCFLVQLPAFEAPEVIFGDYVYFSSYSSSWLEHARRYVEMVTPRFGLGADSQVVELASNDGYLLQYFVERGVPVLGVEPANTVAAAAREKGIPTVEEFFGVALAERLSAEGKSADLILGNNVLAHVPDLNDFVAGIAVLLTPHGVVTLEFPHLMQLVDRLEYDTIYHEHFSYFSLVTVDRVLRAHGLTLFDVEELPTHGGSLRIYARHAEDESREVQPSVPALLERERAAGFEDMAYYHGFQPRVDAAKRDLLRFLIAAKDEGKTVVGYGAPAKGNTMLNYCGVRSDLLEYTVDRNPHKQGLFLPGVHIPVLSPARLAETRPDYVLILPWNIKDEIVEQQAGIREWGGRFVVPLPDVEVL